MSARIYIAGPMSRLPDYNYPAFNRAAAKLREAGWHVESPAEPGQVDGWGWGDYMRRGLQQMLTCDVIALLPGWHDSRGATLELRLAEALGMRTIILDADGVAVAQYAAWMAESPRGDVAAGLLDRIRNGGDR